MIGKTINDATQIMTRELKPNIFLERGIIKVFKEERNLTRGTQELEANHNAITDLQTHKWSNCKKDKETTTQYDREQSKGSQIEI